MRRGKPVAGSGTRSTRQSGRVAYLNDTSGSLQWLRTRQALSLHFDPRSSQWRQHRTPDFHSRYARFVQQYKPVSNRNQAPRHGRRTSGIRFECVRVLGDHLSNQHPRRIENLHRPSQRGHRHRPCVLQADARGRRGLYPDACRFYLKSRPRQFAPALFEHRMITVYPHAGIRSQQQCRPRLELQP